MKLVIVVPDGMSDWRYPALGNLSPAEVAQTPGLDRVVRRGRVGLVRTMYEGLPLGSLVGFLGLLGYDPRRYFPLGRSIFEARALGLALSPADLIFRCNIVRVNGHDRLADFTAGQIGEASARRYLDGLPIAPPFEIHHDLSYRNVLIYRDCPLALEDLYLYPPHDHVGGAIEPLLPRYQGRLFEPLVAMMAASRRDGLMLWPWGPGRPRTFPPMPFRMGLVTALSFLHGLATSLGAQAIRPAGVTGYLGSDLGAKLAALLALLPAVDVGLVHCNAPDEEAHVHNLAGKVQAIEEIDRLVISPLLDYLEGSGDPYRLLICPDHYTCCGDGRHHPEAVPYVVAGHGLSPNHSLSTYSEAAIHAAIKDIGESYRLIASLRPDP